MKETKPKITKAEGKVSSPQTKRSAGKRGAKALPVLPPSPGVVVGIDISEKHVNLCEIDTDGVITETRLANSAKKLTDHFESKPKRRIIIEVGAHTRWIAELLERLGHQVLVVDPRRVKLISGSLYKDDRVDAQTLAMLGRDAPTLLKTVRMRGLESQMVLTLVRARASAVKARTQLVNALRGLLKPYGYVIPKQGRDGTFGVHVRDTLDAALLRLVGPLLTLIENLNAEIKRYDKDVETVLPRHAPEAVHLTKINGVGALTVLYFVALVGDPERFGKNRDIGAYLGLCRRRQDSGDYQSELGITKAGDRLMRALLANCASYILGPFGQDSDLRQWGLRKTAGGSRKEKKKAKIAVARKLAVLMLTLWKSRHEYEPFRRNPEPTMKAA